MDLLNEVKPTIDSSVLALVAAMLGGAGVKIIDWAANKKTSDHVRRLEERKELWDEMKDLKERQTALEQEVVCWKNKYYELLKEYNTMDVAFQALKLKVEELEKTRTN